MSSKDSMPASSHFLGKPYSRAALAAKIRSALSDSGTAVKEEAP